jgi:hypothetical protein
MALRREPCKEWTRLCLLEPGEPRSMSPHHPTLAIGWNASPIPDFPSLSGEGPPAVNGSQRETSRVRNGVLILCSTRRINRNAGSPNGREPHGDGVPIVAKRPGQRPGHDEGGQVSRGPETNRDEECCECS